MRLSVYQKLFSAFAVCLLVIISAIANFLAQNTQPSPSPSPSPQPSPSVSAIPTPARMPSPTPLPGAQNFHQWGSITVFNGLPSDSVRAIAQTPDGVMWFGTDNGLARFDGRRIQNVSVGSAESDRITALKTDATGQLWAGTGNGAFVYSGNDFKAVDGTQGAGVLAILISGEVFLGTDSGLVLRVSAQNGVLSAEKVFPDPVLADDGSPLGITSLIENDGKLLAGTPGRGVFVASQGSVAEYSTSVRPIFVNALAKSGSGKLSLGADAARSLSGIYIVESGPPAQRIAAPTGNVLSLEANDSGLWAGTERNGLFHIADSKLAKSYTFENTSGGLRSNTIFTLFTDREGVIWIGTNRGVSRFDRLGPFQQTVSDSPNSNFVRTLFRYSEGLPLLAGSNRGLFEYNGKTWDEADALRGKTIYAIDSVNLDPEKLVVGTPEGVFDLRGRLVLGGDARSINYFQGRTYVAIYGRGVFDISGTTPQLVFANEGVTSLGGYVEKLWIGTSGNGLFSFDGNNTKPELSPETLKSGTIWKIYEAGSQTGVWIGAQHGVFFILNGISEQIVAAEDVRDVWGGTENHVWAASTTRGLIHARRDERFGWLVSSIGFEQGLPSEKAFAILPTKENFFVATNRGVVTYKPGTIAPRLIATRILSQRMHNLGELGSAIELDYPQNSLLVEVAGQSSRTFPEEFQYAFVLSNSRGETIDSRLSRDPQYAPKELAPGGYVIEALAFDRDLNTSEPLQISFSVAKAPFPWTAAALGVLLAVALIALVWVVVERRQIAQRNRDLAAARFDLANEAERERRRIARDLHDQTLADLRNLMISSDKLVNGNTGFRSEIEAVSTEVRRICEDLSPSVLENVGLVAALEFLLSRTIKNKRFTADETAEERIDFPLNVQLQIYRIAQEVLTNIERHSSADMVEMSASVLENGHFQLTIRDNGKLFQPDRSIDKGRGISNIRSRANLINAKVAWKEQRKGGNVFSLRLDGQASMENPNKIISLS